MIEPQDRQFTHDLSVDAAYLYVSAGAVAASEEIAVGVIVDRDADRRVIGIEVLDIRRRIGSGDVLSYLLGLEAGIETRLLDAAE